MQNVRRYISYFSKVDEAHAGDLTLPEIELSAIQVLFKEKKENPMYDCYPITENEAGFFRNLAEISFDFEKYDYFLEAEEE